MKNILFDLLHPAHVHLFRNFMEWLRNEGHGVHVTTRDKDVTNILLDHYGFKYETLTSRKKGIGMIVEQLVRDMKILRLNRKVRFDFAYGTSASIPLLSIFHGATTVSFNEDDDRIAPLYCVKAYTGASEVWNPSCSQRYAWLGRRRPHNSYHELAYLHPDRFTPDPSIPERYGLMPRKYAVMRSSALMALHDIGAKGLRKETCEKIKDSLEGLQTVSSSELSREHQVKPWDLHHILAFAKLVAGDSLTVSLEAAVLGTPSFLLSSFARRIACLQEMNSYGLLELFEPGEDESFLEAIRTAAASDTLERDFAEKRSRLLKEKSDLTAIMIDDFKSKTSKG